MVIMKMVPYTTQKRVLIDKIFHENQRSAKSVFQESNEFQGLHQSESTNGRIIDMWFNFSQLFLKHLKFPLNKIYNKLD